MTGDALANLRKLVTGSIHCVVTSPPYWNLRDYQVSGQIGLEDSIDEYIEKMVEVFREVRRVLRDDGTFWLNIGDSYATSRPGSRDGDRWPKQSRNNHVPGRNKIAGIKPKNLLGIPWTLAFALRDDGWYLRSNIIWVKPNPMPESANDRPSKAHEDIFLLTKSPHYFYDSFAVRQSVTGNSHDRGSGVHKKCKTVDPGDHHNRPKSNPSFSSAVSGLVDSRNLRSVWKFPWHEDRFITMLAEFVEHLLEAGVDEEIIKSYAESKWPESEAALFISGLLTTWNIPTQPYPDAHFATFPEAIPRQCIQAGTSEKGCCPKCGMPAEREVEKHRKPTRPGKNTKVHVPTGWETGGGHHGSFHKDGRRQEDNAAWRFSRVPRRGELEVGNRDPERHITTFRTKGWKITCNCGIGIDDLVPCVVLDPFVGSGTTLAVANQLGRSAIGIELNPTYVELATRRIQRTLRPSTYRDMEKSDSTLFGELDG